MSIIVLIIIILIINFILKFKHKEKESQNSYIPDAYIQKYLNKTYKVDITQNNEIKEINHNIYEENYNKYYKPKRYLTTLNELNFYNVLLEIAKELNMILFAQVSLYNILSIKKELDYSTKTKYFNKIASKSIDFVLVDKKDCRIKLCIELDDSTHQKAKRIERDKFINKLFKDLEINLLRYPVYKVYYKETLKKKVLENIKEHYYIN